MIHTEIIEHAIRLAIITPFIENEKGISLILIAPPEHGKTEILKKFAFVPSVKISTDFNSFHFADYALEYLNGKKKTIIIPDFIKIVKKKYSTQASILATLNAITEEGWIGKLPLGQYIDKPVFGNVITSITDEELNDKRHKWNKMGFLSRFIPLSYSYFEKTKKQIREYIKDRIYHNDKPVELSTPQTLQSITLPKEIANKIEKITLQISEQNNILGFRLQRQLQVLALANALCSQRNIVTTADFDVIKEISKFINYNFNPL